VDGGDGVGPTLTKILKRAEPQLPIAVHGDNFPIENGLDWQRLQSGRNIRKTVREILLVSRPELDTRFRPNGNGSVAVEL
jgi:hypothetical protein